MSAHHGDRRTVHGAALRRLITAGNLLAAAARGQVTATPELADAWDSSVETLRAGLNEPPCHARHALAVQTGEEVPLGAEADVSHVRMPKGGAR